MVYTKQFENKDSACLRNNFMCIVIQIFSCYVSRYVPVIVSYITMIPYLYVHPYNMYNLASQGIKKNSAFIIFRNLLWTFYNA